MTDIIQNQTIKEGLSRLSKTLKEICGNYKGNESFDRLEGLFNPPGDKESANLKLNSIKNEYAILDKNTISQQKDLNQFAKELLNSPFTPSVFKGNYILPKAMCYSSKNSYVNIFYAGNYLDSMASEDISGQPINKSIHLNDKAISILERLAPYATTLEQVYTTYNESLVYYITASVLDNNLKLFTLLSPR